jgi:hypothetical protein
VGEAVASHLLGEATCAAVRSSAARQVQSTLAAAAAPARVGDGPRTTNLALMHRACIVHAAGMPAGPRPRAQTWGLALWGTQCVGVAVASSSSSARRLAMNTAPLRYIVMAMRMCIHVQVKK